MVSKGLTWRWTSPKQPQAALLQKGASCGVQKVCPGAWGAREGDPVEGWGMLPGQGVCALLGLSTPAAVLPAPPPQQGGRAGVSPCRGFGMQHGATEGSDGVWGLAGQSIPLQSTGAAVGGANGGAR